MDGLEVDSHSSLVKLLPTAFKTAVVVVLLFIWRQKHVIVPFARKSTLQAPRVGPYLAICFLMEYTFCCVTTLKIMAKCFLLVCLESQVLLLLILTSWRRFWWKISGTSEIASRLLRLKSNCQKRFFLNAMMLGGASAPRLPRRSAQRKWKGWYPWSKIGWEIDANIRRRCQYRKVGLLFEQNLF